MTGSLVVRHRLVRTVVAGALAATLGGGAVAEAHYNLGKFTRRIDNTTCVGGRDDLVDPINVAVLTTANAMADLAGRRLNMGLTGFPAGGSQRLPDHGACDEQAAQRARRDGNFGRQKSHVRVWGNQDRDRKNREISAGDAHYERLVDCKGPAGDSVYENIQGRSGFDYAQREWLHAMGDLYYGYIKRPRRGPFPQCERDDGRRRDKPGWNGRMLVFTSEPGR